MTGGTAHMKDDPNVVTHRTPTSHWCAGCWHWVVDCEHVVDRLRLPHRLTPRDLHVLSFAYDPKRQCLEIFYRWKSAEQYHPISPKMFREIEEAPQIGPVLDKWIKQRRIIWEEVRTARKILATMVFCGLRMVVDREI